MTFNEWTHIVVCVSSGKHTGAADQATVLTDSGASYDALELIGGWLHNTSNGEYGAITDNAAGTITCSGGGFDHDNNDNYNVVKIYINGTADLPDTNDDSGTPTSADNEPKYYIGVDDSGDRQFIGEVDDVLVYDDKWLTEAEVNRIYKAGKRSHR